MPLKIFFFIFSISLFSCSNQEEKKAEKKVKITNPNGMSEMSLIMEEWYDVMLKFSSQLKDNYVVDNVETIKQNDIYKAKTSKTGVHGKQFDAFADGFFYNFNEIENTISYGEQVAQFNLAVKSCVNCHEQFCPGPMVRIKKLTVAN